MVASQWLPFQRQVAVDPTTLSIGASDNWQSRHGLTKFFVFLQEAVKVMDPSNQSINYCAAADVRL